MSRGCREGPFIGTLVASGENYRYYLGIWGGI